MLSLFPQLFDWSWYVPFVLRLFLAWYALDVGIGFVRSGRVVSEKDKKVLLVLGALLTALGVLYLIGLYTQILGVIGFVIALLPLYLKKRVAAFFPESMKFYVLVALVSLALVFLGAGPYAIDIPL